MRTGLSLSLYHDYSKYYFGNPNYIEARSLLFYYIGNQNFEYISVVNQIVLVEVHRFKLNT